MATITNQFPTRTPRKLPSPLGRHTNLVVKPEPILKKEKTGDTIQHKVSIKMLMPKLATISESPPVTLFPPITAVNKEYKIVQPNNYIFGKHDQPNL
jgi:hypothetical protein